MTQLPPSDDTGPALSGRAVVVPLAGQLELPYDRTRELTEDEVDRIVSILLESLVIAHFPDDGPDGYLTAVLGWDT